MVVSLFSILTLAVATSATVLPGLPTVPFELDGNEKSWDISSLKSVIVDNSYADARNEKGMTLIPPKLSDFANTFAQDLKDALGHEVNVELGSSGGSDKVFLTLGDESEYLDVAGRETSEGYTFDVGADGVVITGASPLGVWWGTRTFIQQVLIGEGKIPFGSGKDSPGWGERGVMLDVGRHYYPPDFLIELCSYMSFFKQNVFHIHLSDNLYNNVKIYGYERQMSLYSAFRLLSDDPAVEGLAKRQNESYTRDVWDDVQSKCVSRGVTLLPEIESPGHSLPISQWKPEIGMSSDYSLLNISHPDTIPTVKTIWKTFLPWFQSKIVHIGADEYRDESLDDLALAKEYTTFCNEMKDFIKEESGKDMRLWGTFPPSKNGDVDRNVSVQHWANFEALAGEWLDSGYQVLNSWDSVYIVGKWNQWYGQQLNLSFIFHGAPDKKPFSPNIFDSSNTTANTEREDGRIYGHIAPQWNDYGPNATTVLEAYYSWRDGLPALADKQWGGELTADEYPGLFAAIHPHIPAQNLDRRVKTKTSTIMDIDFSSTRYCDGKFKDSSGNGYDVTTNCTNTAEGVLLEPGCEVATPLESKGRNYTLTFGVKPTSDAKGPIFTGRDSALWYGNGTVDSVMMFSGESVYALNYTFPVGEWTNATLRAQGTRTYLDVGSDAPREFLTVIGWTGDKFVWDKMAFEAPIAKIGGGGFQGLVSGLKLVDTDF
ncbi:unnamed protein product [Clonostachys rosea]|uniref:beta-N-acetylhexosaminidase n=1 Tax=Bionectria ochroleuca TaxID=29856 RepID=A0ABY6UNN4_BIOOC|nr:unnamed protein product [Clonostachys rosea]